MIRLRDLYGADGQPYQDGIIFLYTLLGQRPPEANISHAKMPTFEEHEAFVRRRAYRAWYIITQHDFAPVGAIYATHSNEIGIFIEKSQQHKGYASAAIKILIETLDPLPAMASTRHACWLANVAPKNWRSKMLFEKKFGARIIQLTYQIPRRDHGNEESRS